jgi:hypothetical protein
MARRPPRPRRAGLVRPFVVSLWRRFPPRPRRRGAGGLLHRPRRHRPSAGVLLLRGRARSARGGQAAHQGRDAADGGGLRKAAGGSQPWRLGGSITPRTARPPNPVIEPALRRRAVEPHKHAGCVGALLTRTGVAFGNAECHLPLHGRWPLAISGGHQECVRMHPSEPGISRDGCRARRGSAPRTPCTSRPAHRLRQFRSG